MARIAGVDIPNDKTRSNLIDLRLWYRDLQISKKTGCCWNSEDVRVRDLTSDQEDAIRREVDAIKVDKVTFVVK